MNRIITYRPEIDGLRTVAVLSVLIFHAGFTHGDQILLSGGFLGVDVFFVISGYLITSIILTEIGKGKFSYPDFYKRRAKRILPALLFVIMVTVPFAWTYLYPQELNEYTESLISSLFFYSNFQFWSEDPYWSTAGEFKPLLHTWSLAVEEQYYLFIPVLLVFLYRLGKTGLLMVLVSLCVISLVLALVFTPKDPSTTFYLLPFRLWELMLGGILATVEIHSGRKKHGKFDNAVTVLGFTAMMLSFIFVSEQNLHPHLVTLIPVVSTGLIIFFSSPADIVTKILSSRLFVATGLISYSLYLWHYPVFTFARMTDTGFESPVTKVLLILLSFGAAIFSYYLIETPVRRGTIKPRQSIFMLVLASACILVFAAYVDDRGALERYADSFPHYGSTVFDNKLLKQSSWHSVRETGQSFRLLSKTNVLFIGNSHAKDIFNAFHSHRQRYPDAEFVRFGTDTRDDFNICASVDSLTDTRLFKDADVIVLGTRAKLDRGRRNKCLSELVNGIRSKNKRIVLASRHYIYKRLADDPKWSSRLHKMTVVDRHLLYASLTEDDLPRLESEQYELLEDDSHQYRDLYAEFARENHIEFLDFTQLQCNHSTKRCPVLDQSGNKIYYDHHHWSYEGAAYFGKQLLQQGMIDFAPD